LKGNVVGSCQLAEVGVHAHSFQGFKYDTNRWKTGDPYGGYVVYAEPQTTSTAGGESRPINVYVEFLIFVGKVSD